MPFVACQRLPATHALQHFTLSTEKKPGGTVNILEGGESSQLHSQIHRLLRVCSILMVRLCISAYRTFIAFKSLRYIVILEE